VWKTLPFTPAAIKALQELPWRGNVRELRNAVERLLLLTDEVADRGTVEMVLRSASGEAAGVPANLTGTTANGPLASRVAEFERATLLAELERQHRHITNTAKALDLERSHFYKKCQQLGIDLSQVGREAGK
jgi:two-component system, NtrC family, nitrogen regulation response regulator NtrX